MTDVPVDLRSDTVTRPDAAMRRAMAEAVVGDDVYGEDPTVRRLEEEGAAAVGCEAAVFVPSGTMGNQIALHLHGERGTEVVSDARAHVNEYEMAGAAAWSGLQSRTVSAADGLAEVDAWRAAIHPRSFFRARTSVMVLENTHNMAGGRAFDRRRLDPILALARANSLRVHLDGARLFNAAVALDRAPAALVEGFDSVMFCLSKGLGAPVGSLLAGERHWIDEARLVRKRLGGGMRQAGVLAAAGLEALRAGPGRLADDHRRARRLAEAVVEVGFDLEPSAVETNIVIFGTAPGGAEAVVAELARRAVLCAPVSSSAVRFVTHRDVDDAAIERAVDALRAAFRAPAPAGARGVRESAR
jgi:threonine aldolase